MDLPSHSGLYCKLFVAIQLVCESGLVRAECAAQFRVQIALSEYIVHVTRHGTINGIHYYS